MFKPRFLINHRLLAACAVLASLSMACAPSGAPVQSTATAALAPASPAPTRTVGAPSSVPSSVAPTTASVGTTSAAPTGAAAQATQPAGGSQAIESIRLVVVPGDTEARYRVREQLAKFNFPSDAVGTTRAVTGTIVARADGTVVSSESKIQVDLNTLTSNERLRDNFIKGNVLQTNRYPNAVFVATSVQGLALPPKPGPVAFKLTGDLTIRNVTKPVTWDVTGNVASNDDASGTAVTSFAWDYFNLQKPSVAVVLSVEDTIRLEIDIHLRRVAN